MGNLRDIIMKAVSDLNMVLKPLQEQDDRINLLFEQSTTFADGIAHLGARDALIDPQIEAITSQKNLVEAAVAKEDPEGKDKELVTTFFFLVKTLQSDCRKTREHIQAWDETLNELDSLDQRMQNITQDEAKIKQQVLDMKAKNDKKKDLLRLAWSVMSEEIGASRQEQSRTPTGGSTGIH